MLTRTAASNPLWGFVKTIPHGIFSLFFPDECRICNQPLTKCSRAPVCEDCLRFPAPLHCEFECALCRTPFANEFPLDRQGICAACRSGLRSFNRAAAFGMYEGTLRRLIHLYKYSGVKPLAHPLTELLDRAVPDGEDWDAIVPVPLHWRKRWQRGFNQSGLLARGLAKRRGLPMWNALYRRRPTEAQAGLAAAGRRRNVSGAFEIRRAYEPRNGARLKDARLILIDDVLTTGATANACAAALKRAGAKSVSLVTVARADRRWRP